MNWWRPPEKGPEKPRCRSFLTSARREIATGGLGNRHFPDPYGDPADFGDRLPIP